MPTFRLSSPSRSTAVAAAALSAGLGLGLGLTGPASGTAAPQSLPVATIDDGKFPPELTMGELDLDVLAWSWGASRSGAGPRGAGQLSVQDLSITAWSEGDVATAMKDLAAGTVFPRALLTFGGQTIEMRDVSFSSISQGGSRGEDRLTANITLNASSFVQTIDGVSSGPVNAGR